MLSIPPPTSVEHKQPELCKKPTVSWAAVTYLAQAEIDSANTSSLLFFFSPIVVNQDIQTCLLQLEKSLTKNPV